MKHRIGNRPAVGTGAPVVRFHTGSPKTREGLLALPNDPAYTERRDFLATAEKAAKVFK